MKQSLNRVFRDASGRVRPWVGLCALLAAACLALDGLGALYGLAWRRLMAFWGVDRANYTYAIWPVKALYAHADGVLGSLQGLALIGLCRAVIRPGGGHKAKGRALAGCLGLAAGMAAAGLIWLILRALDAVRLGAGHHLSALGAGGLLIDAAGRALLVGGVGVWARALAVSAADGAKSRVSRIVALLIGAAAGLFGLCRAEGGLSAATAAAGALYGALCALSAMKKGPLGPAFMAGLCVAERQILGFSAWSAAVWESYTVYGAWLTGGDRGLTRGWACAALLALCLAAEGLIWLRRSGQTPPDRANS